MARYSSGKFALRISDRDGRAYPYNEMVQEWTGAWVHTSEYEPKSPLNPTNHPTDAQSLQHAKPQIVSSRVFVGGPQGPAIVNANDIPLGQYNSGGDGLSVNSFQTLDESFTAYHANGAAYVGTRKSMMPLSIQQPNKKTQLISRTGNVTVSIS